MCSQSERRNRNLLGLQKSVRSYIAWTSRHLQVVSLHLKPWASLSRPLHASKHCVLFLPCERNALYIKKTPSHTPHKYVNRGALIRCLRVLLWLPNKPSANTPRFQPVLRFVFLPIFVLHSFCPALTSSHTCTMVDSTERVDKSLSI